MSFDSYVLPVVIGGVIAYGISRKTDIFQVFVEGAKEGAVTSVEILPALVGLMTCIGMFSASGALDVLTYAIKPLTDLIQLPQEAIPLAILRPISGSGALVIFQELLKKMGPDSYVGQVASTMMGSSETTFYTIAVYFGAIKVARTRHTLPAALVADIVGYAASVWAVRLLLW